MRVAPSEYAQAFLAVLEKGAREEAALGRLKDLLIKNGDRAKAPRVLEEIERRIAARSGGKVVRIEFAREPEPKVKEKLLSHYSSLDRVRTAIDPGLLAGVRIVTNGEEELDVSLRGKLRSLLGN